jgi:hypothetical protein
MRGGGGLAPPRFYSYVTSKQRTRIWYCQCFGGGISLGRLSNQRRFDHGGIQSGWPPLAIAGFIRLKALLTSF